MLFLRTMKIFKFAEDPCFGQKHNEINTCEKCVINRSCGVFQKNAKNKEAKLNAAQ